MSGVTAGELYEELRCAIVQQRFPATVQPLDWTFSTIVSGYNAHPVFNELYDFELAVRHGLDPAKKPSVLDSTEAEQLLGYEPAYSLGNLLEELKQRDELHGSEEG
jgi:hypothetical protein